MRTNKQKTYKAKYLISSIPINQYIHIDFIPKLPYYKRNLFKNMTMGNLHKVVVTYKRAFWKDNGFSGESISDGSVLTTISPDNGSKDPILGPISVRFSN